mgnify:CR=1 FL=1
MTYKELAEHLSKLTDEQSNTEVTFYDDSNGRYFPANSLEVIDIEPTFPPLVYLTLAPDVMISINVWQISNCPLFTPLPLNIPYNKNVQTNSTNENKSFKRSVWTVVKSNSNDSLLLLIKSSNQIYN